MHADRQPSGSVLAPCPDARPLAARARCWVDRIVGRRGASLLAALHSDTRGALLVEYSVLIGAIAIAGSLGLILVGVALVRSFDFVRGLLLCPVP